MKVQLLIILITACGVKFTEGYLCYECNSTFDKNCFDFSPKFSYYKGAYCDTEETGAENCYAVQISDRKVRRMYRGCKKVGICDDYEEQERTNIQFKVLSCSECNEHYCNSNHTINCFSTALITFILFFVLRFLC